MKSIGASNCRSKPHILGFVMGVRFDIPQLVTPDFIAADQNVFETANLCLRGKVYISIPEQKQTDLAKKLVEASERSSSLPSSVPTWVEKLLKEEERTTPKPT